MAYEGDSKDAATPDNASNKPQFTEKEAKLLSAAMLSLKSGGLPDIDMHKFQKNGGFNTTKTAQNTWAKLKKKLQDLELENGDSTPNDGDGASSPEKPKSTPTPSPSKATPKKGSAKKREVGDEGDGAGPAKKARTPRKTPTKKAKQTVVAGEDEPEKNPEVKSEDQADANDETSDNVKVEDVASENEE